MTPSSAQGAGAAPLMGTAGIRNLFFPAIEEGEGRAADAPAAADDRRAEQCLQAKLAAVGACGEDQCSADAGLAEEAHANIPGPEGRDSKDTACAVEAQTPLAADATPTGYGSASAEADVDSMMACDSAELSPAGDALAMVVSPGLATCHIIAQQPFPPSKAYVMLERVRGNVDFSHEP